MQPFVHNYTFKDAYLYFMNQTSPVNSYNFSLDVIISGSSVLSLDF